MLNQDRRVFVRFVSKSTLRFKNLETGLTKQVYMRDVSGGGLKFVSTEHVINLNDALELWIEPPASEPIRLKGKVMWLKEITGDVWDVGISFDRARLRSLSNICSPQNAVAIPSL